ncbi:MAG TPA: NADP-dependent malic enzyme [Thermoplasmata archaeon]|jgi:malate dehydrogenase (oxaloacetate-decarboxylating)|nr:NADP-dependent malic enzyme [Thermoplasmata archaeon]
MASKRGAPRKKPKPVDVAALLKKANEPGVQAMKLHPFYQGKIEIGLKTPVRSFDDFAIWYTPGVAKPCLEIAKRPEAVYEMTNKWNNVAIVTDGTRVLGLGDIGPEAGLPVMEGKSLLFKFLGGVDAFPICLKTKDPDEIVETVQRITPAFGGVNLEDIAQPKCFDILARLRASCEIPVWHDDQQGTATIIVAGAINAVKVVGKTLADAKIAMVGAGASNVRTAYILMAAGAKAKNIVMTDSTGILNTQRRDLAGKFPEKWDLAQKTNGEGRSGGIPEAMKGADLVIAASKPGPGVIQKGWVRGMADDAIVFAIANPVPEIWPWEAAEAGAKVVATGRSDFPNQVNNSLGFPGIFRGTLDVRAKTITDEMCLAAARELARIAEDEGLREDYIVPTMEHEGVFAREAVAVGMKAIEQGIARVKKSRKELLERAQGIIHRARSQAQHLMDAGYIRTPP